MEWEIVLREFSDDLQHTHCIRVVSMLRAYVSEHLWHMITVIAGYPKPGDIHLNGQNMDLDGE